MKKHTLPIVIAIFCLVQITLFVKINTLQNKIQNMENNLTSSISGVRSGINTIYSNVDEKLKQQSSIIDNIDYKLGDVDPATLTVPATFTLTPKEITKESIVTLYISDQIFTMARNGTTFEVTAPLSIFNESTPKVTIEDKDSVKSEHLNHLSLENIKEKVLPVLYSSIGGQSSYQSGMYHRTGTLDIEYKKADSNVAFTEARLLIEVDNKVISNKKISSDQEWNQLSHEIDEAIPLKENQTYTMTLIATDTLGLVHHSVVDSWEDGDGFRQANLEEETIYNKNGELLYKPEYIQLN
ncbi:hypothetical protein [Sinanaerobacter sp. ZZT-01]|uniref:hypothetical protein n=1 Tax=Sinanaerobacter sp. ZZT-01 TaxID=3111540 RepID=UPI002D7859B6|nr:hypothetical protein [Sinanaerobacter sp. ZZT-01]WRR93039.1 hypothetical protein U5921_13530 [Sinanaerobacter sp. ZZT-01]